MIITIDGPAGAGKSTIARLLAEELKFLYVDTGAMYRALTLKVLGANIGFADLKALIEIANQTSIRLKKAKLSGTCVFLDGIDVTHDIRKPEVTNAVFHIAEIPEIRDIMAKWQRQYAQAGNIVMEGRDIGTVIFPQAEVKFYLDAKVRIRAQRRQNELKQKGIEIGLDQLISQIKDRDKKDKSRICGPLKKADDAITVDTTNLNIEQVVKTLLKFIKA